MLHSWSGIWDATRESSPCLHRDQFSGEYLGSEDCLYLNVYTNDVSKILKNRKGEEPNCYVIMVLSSADKANQLKTRYRVHTRWGIYVRFQ